MSHIRMTDIVTKLVTNLFTSACGNWQSKKPESERKAFLMEFSTRIDYGLESGYRYVDLLLYGDMNYIGVWQRTRWTVIPLEDLDEVDGDTYVKPGKAYQEGASEWALLSYHDSGWIPAVRDFFIKNELYSISGLDSYHLVNPAEYNLPNEYPSVYSGKLKQ